MADEVDPRPDLSRRNVSIGPLRNDAEGRPLCRWCGSVVKPPRRSWCGDACVEEWRLTTSAGQRAHLKKLERGVCRECGLDTMRFRERARRGWRLLHSRHWGDRRDSTRKWRKGYWTHPSGPEQQAAMHQLVERLLGRPAGKIDLMREWWDADHIVPLVEGGTHSAENLRTLCIWCHRDETAALAGRRAEARNPQERLDLG